LINEYDLENPLLHVDIEGAERHLFDEEMDIIDRHCSGVLIEFHPRRLDGRMDDYISMLNDNFHLEGEEDDVFLFLNK